MYYCKIIQTLLLKCQCTKYIQYPASFGLTGTVPRDFWHQFFHLSSSPVLLISPWARLRIFCKFTKIYSQFKVHLRCRCHRCKMNIETENVFRILFRLYWIAVYAYAIYGVGYFLLLSLLTNVFFTLVATCHWRWWHRWQISASVTEINVNLVYGVTTGVIDTGDKFTTVVDNGGAHQLRISSRIYEKFKIVLLG
jgi:hypothetical protein